jgi:outer membrane protein OmpA-like peptidoglycan-associated protein
MKKMTWTAFLAVCTSPLFAQYGVHLAAYEKPVNAKTYFVGFPNAYEQKDLNQIYHYYVNCETSTAAEQVKGEAVKAGYTKAWIRDFQDVKNQCKLDCGEKQSTPTIGQKMEKPKEIQASKPIVSSAKVDIPVELTNFLFEFNKYELTNKYFNSLDEITKILKANPAYLCEIQAHCDAIGSDKFNKELSLKRAATVKKYLLSKGVKSSSVIVKYYGESAPIALNQFKDGKDAEEGRRFNRRVEISVYNLNNGDSPVNIQPLDVPSMVKI